MPRSSLVFLIALALVSPAVAADQPKKPSIVFILCDDLGYGDLGCFGHKIIKTPHLDKLAAGGLRMTSFYSPSPVCSPSRAGYLTGRNPNRAGIRDWIPLNSGIYLKKTDPSVAKLLKAGGYRTAHVGKWHLNSKMDGTEPTPGDHGFDHWFSTQNNAAPTHQNPVNFIRNGKKVGKLTGNSSTLIVDEAIRWLGSIKDEPFVLFVWFHAPHEPVATPEAWTKKYSDIKEPTKRTYYGSVSLMDHEVGRLLKHLDDKKKRDNTLVFFTSDNGPETLNRYKGAQRSHGSPGPLRGMKLHMHEAGYRVPAILSWPGKTKAGTVTSEAIGGVDLLPTLLEAAGIEPGASVKFDGTSFLPVLQGKSITRKVPLYWQYDRAISKPYVASVRIGAYKLLADAKLKKLALFDLEKDIGEKMDLAEKEPRRVKTLADALGKMYRDINGK